MTLLKSRDAVDDLKQLLDEFWNHYYVDGYLCCFSMIFWIAFQCLCQWDSFYGDHEQRFCYSCPLIPFALWHWAKSIESVFGHTLEWTNKVKRMLVLSTELKHEYPLNAMNGWKWMNEYVRNRYYQFNVKSYFQHAINGRPHERTNNKVHAQQKKKVNVNKSCNHISKQPTYPNSDQDSCVRSVDYCRRYCCLGIHRDRRVAGTICIRPCMTGF